MPPEPAGVVVHRIDTMVDGFVVERDRDGAYRVRGKRIERIASQTNFDVEESAERFQRDLERMGIDAELRRAGVEPGDLVGSAGPSSNGSRCRGKTRDGGERAPRGATGVFGGTFDPIHLAHLAVAEAARDTFGLRRVLFIPAGQPPHKPGRIIAPVEDRLAMVEAAVAGNPAFEVCRVEVDREGPSYTVDTLQELRLRAMSAWRSSCRRSPSASLPPGGSQNGSFGWSRP